MKTSNKCENCKNKCKIYSAVRIDIICPKYEKVINTQIEFKLPKRM